MRAVGRGQRDEGRGCGAGGVGRGAWGVGRGQREQDGTRSLTAASIGRCDESTNTLLNHRAS
jgi:hypothetical protein